MFNFGLHDTAEPTPPPRAREGARPPPAESHYMTLLRRYTELVLHSGRVKKGLWASTTPYMVGAHCAGPF